MTRLANFDDLKPSIFHKLETLLQISSQRFKKNVLAVVYIVQTFKSAQFDHLLNKINENKR